MFFPSKLLINFKNRMELYRNIYVFLIKLKDFHSKKSGNEEKPRRVV